MKKNRMPVIFIMGTLIVAAVYFILPKNEIGNSEEVAESVSSITAEEADSYTIQTEVDDLRQSPYELYAKVLDDCKYMIGYGDLEDYDQNGCKGVLEDLNNDGTEELILTYLKDYEKRCEIWTVKDNQTVCIFDILAGAYENESFGGYLDLMEFQEKCYLTFFSRTVGESLEQEDWIFYEMTDQGYLKAHTLQIQYSYDRVYEVPRAERYMYDGKEILESEFFAICPEKIADIINLGGDKLDEGLLNSVTNVYYETGFMEKEVNFETLLGQLESKKEETGDKIHEVYGEFLVHKSYEKYVLFFGGMPESYGIVDINADEIPELLIKSEYDVLTDSTEFLVFGYDVIAGEIVFMGDEAPGDLQVEYQLLP